MLRGSMIAVAVLLGGCTSGATLPTICVDAGCQCSSDQQCAGATPRCDTNAGLCVPCLPVKDNCPTGQHCMVAGGTFACGGCQVASDCPKAGQACCSGTCVDTQADPHNCGGCANNCQVPPNASAGCSAGTCGIGSCAAGYSDCDKNTSTGCEVHSDVDEKNCGACGMACTHGPHQSTACTAGACVSTCEAGWSHCSGNAADGCEAHTDVDPTNCGVCHMACGPLANAAALCKAGVCSVGSCGDGFGDCDGTVQNGCETDLKADVANCSACGKACAAVANGVAACQNGFCAVGKCNAGWADCDGLAANGCETDISSDRKNCGACGRTCAGSQSAQVCQASACVISACTPGYADCDHLPETGCEANTGADVANCGMCGNVCPVPTNAVAGCSNAACGIGMCNLGFANCNGDVKDGCEVNQLSDTKNCGGCGNLCMTPNATPACTMGKCAVGMCAMGFGDCNKQVLDGCESDLSSDAKNCSSCGKVCALANATSACMAGSCTIAACKAGFADCDMNTASGCEIDTMSDPHNCGGCGLTCPKDAPACRQSQCAMQVCHDIGYAQCPTGASEWCDDQAIDGTSSTQALNACNTCYFQPGQGNCILSIGDCAGPGYSFAVQKGPTWGYQKGCSGSSGRVWDYGGSFTTYGFWAP